MSTAYIFPGQGSQTVGMGAALVAVSPAARRTFEQADDILGFALSKLCFEGPEGELTATWNAQPALLVSSIAAYRAAVEDGVWELPAEEPAFLAGHSLGEYSALVVAGSLDYGDALRLVRQRGELMHACGQQIPSTMAAVLGLDEAAVREISAEAGVDIANFNAPGQVGISGALDAVARAGELAKAKGAKRVLPLNVSAAFHSRVMQPAADGLTTAVNAVPVRDTAIPLVTNVSALPIQSADDIRRELIDQLTLPVRWQQTVEFLAANGVTRLLEIGSGTVLCGLAKRIAPALVLANPLEQALGKGRS